MPRAYSRASRRSTRKTTAHVASHDTHAAAAVPTDAAAGEKRAWQYRRRPAHLRSVAFPPEAMTEATWMVPDGSRPEHCRRHSPDSSCAPASHAPFRNLPGYAIAPKMLHIPHLARGEVGPHGYPCGQGSAGQQAKDIGAVGTLFAEGAICASHPLEPSYRGREEIRAYWRWSTANREDLLLRFGEPMLSAEGGVLRSSGGRRSGTGRGRPGGRPRKTGSHFRGTWCFASDGLCEELREYWNFGFGLSTHPLRGWGE